MKKKINLGSKQEALDFPVREPDMYSKRGVPYWFAPEWVRDVQGKGRRIVPLKIENKVELYGVNKEGGVSFIPGSVQVEFQKWHEDRQIDYILLGVNEDELLTPEWFGDTDD